MPTHRTTDETCPRCGAPATVTWRVARHWASLELLDLVVDVRCTEACPLVEAEVQRAFPRRLRLDPAPPTPSPDAAADR